MITSGSNIGLRIYLQIKWREWLAAIWEEDYNRISIARINSNKLVNGAHKEGGGGIRRILENERKNGKKNFQVKKI